MKNIVLSAVAVLAMSSFAVAGGDIAPVEEPVVVPEPVVTDAGFYLGLAYGYANIDASVWQTHHPITRDAYTTDLDTYSTVMIQAGYDFNKYIAVEGRYWFGLDEDFVVGPVNINYGTPANYSQNFDTWGIYVKPQYPVTDAFKIYALLGYANTDAGNAFQDTTADGFSWGLGAAYSFTENFSIFIDYVDMYNDSVDYVDVVRGQNTDMTADLDINTWNFGVTYKF